MPKKPYTFHNSKVPRLFELMEKSNVNSTELANETGISQGCIPKVDKKEKRVKIPLFPVYPALTDQ